MPGSKFMVVGLGDLWNSGELGVLPFACASDVLFPLSRTSLVFDLLSEDWLLKSSWLLLFAEDWALVWSPVVMLKLLPVSDLASCCWVELSSYRVEMTEISMDVCMRSASASADLLGVSGAVSS